MASVPSKASAPPPIAPLRRAAPAAEQGAGERGKPADRQWIAALHRAFGLAKHALGHLGQAAETA